MQNKLKVSARRARRNDRIMTCVFSCIGIFMFAFLVLLTGYIVINGLAHGKIEFLSAGSNGILNQLFNTVYLVAISLLISIPPGIGAGIYLSCYAKKGRFLDFLDISIESLSSLPSIVIGLFGYLVFILTTHLRWNLLAGALAVSILSLPLITTQTSGAIRSLPKSYEAGSLALGATKVQTIRKVLVPSALPQILTGVIMAAGRGFGEAAALLYTAGQSTVINWSRWWDLTSPTCPFNLMRSGETLALHIWVMRTEGSLNPDSAAIAGFASAILVLMTFAFSLCARKLSDRMILKNRGERQ